MMDEAVHLLRTAPHSALSVSWLGSIPFAFGVMLFWSDLAVEARVERCWTDTLLLLVLLAMNNVCRGKAARLWRSQLRSVAAPKPRKSRLVVHCILGNIRFLLLPLAGLVVLPMPYAVAYFRVASLVAETSSEDVPGVMAEARRLASVIGMRSATLCLLLSFSYVIVFANIVVFLASLPFLVRLLTGWESTFSRAGLHLLANSEFWLIAAAFTWVAVEPLVQAVYCVAAFHAESVETGEDLRSRFHTLIRATALSTLLLCIASAEPVPARPVQLQHSIEEIRARPEYRRYTHLPGDTPAPTWVEETTKRLSSLVNWVRGIWERLLAWYKRRVFQTLPGSGSSSGNSLLLYLGCVVALIGAIAVLIRSRWRTRTSPQILTATDPVVLLADVAALSAEQLPEDRWRALAREAVERGDIRVALRALYLSALAWLGDQQWLKLHSGKTDHQYEQELRRRAHTYPEALLTFVNLLQVFERAWYGWQPQSIDTYELFLHGVEELKTRLQMKQVS